MEVIFHMDELFVLIIFRRIFWPIYEKFFDDFFDDFFDIFFTLGILYIF